MCLSNSFLRKIKIGFSETFHSFWGDKSFVSAQILFFCCVTCLNVSSIVDTAQVIDSVLGHRSPVGSGAINFRWNGSLDVHLVDVHLVQWDYTRCSHEMIMEGECLPFLEEEGTVFTAGYAIMLLIFVPMALQDLKVIKLTSTCWSNCNMDSFLGSYSNFCFLRKMQLGKSLGFWYC